ncbi:NBR1-Ig-like domain-containing protein [Nonomuraea sp. B12E4]|uniref:NBR1-Ig-like domain-containing protein n=1 Tax=Nonomuraea sp. B12E4 TaxID=3153564 RepID=UPI00325C5CCC
MAESSASQDEGAGPRRGRKPIRPHPESGPVALLAHRLWRLKEEAGDPSFADMAARLGAAASKSSLAAAARGSTLPTWETTWEFVRVLAVDRLGQDPEEVRREWRAHWEQAARIAGDAKYEAPMPDQPQSHPSDASDPSTPPSQPAQHVEAALSTPTDPSAHPPQPSQADPVDPVDPSDPSTVPLPSARHWQAGPPDPSHPPTRPMSRAGKATVIAVIAVVLGLATVLLAWGLPFADERDQPVARTTPPTSPPASPRDDSAFEGDVTYPDGTVVDKGKTFDKTWRIRNAGTLPWEGRYLTRMNDTPCQAPKRVGIGPVLPGESVDITVRVRAADSPGRCKIFWKMTDANGTPLLAAKKPIFLDVTVA